MLSAWWNSPQTLVQMRPTMLLKLLARPGEVARDLGDDPRGVDSVDGHSARWWPGEENVDVGFKVANELVSPTLSDSLCSPLNNAAKIMIIMIIRKLTLFSHSYLFFPLSLSTFDDLCFDLKDLAFFTAVRQKCGRR